MRPLVLAGFGAEELIGGDAQERGELEDEIGVGSDSTTLVAGDDSL